MPENTFENKPRARVSPGAFVVFMQSSHAEVENYDLRFHLRLG